MQKVRLLVSGKVQGVGWSNVTYVDVTMANFSNYSDFRIAN